MMRCAVPVARFSKFSSFFQSMMLYHADFWWWSGGLCKLSRLWNSVHWSALFIRGLAAVDSFIFCLMARRKWFSESGYASWCLKNQVLSEWIRAVEFMHIMGGLPVQPGSSLVLFEAITANLLVMIYANAFKTISVSLPYQFCPSLKHGDECPYFRVRSCLWLDFTWAKTSRGIFSYTEHRNQSDHWCWFDWLFMNLSLIYSCRINAPDME